MGIILRGVEHSDEEEFDDDDVVGEVISAVVVIDDDKIAPKKFEAVAKAFDNVITDEQSERALGTCKLEVMVDSFVECYERKPSAYTRTIESEVPDICLNEPCCLGIDEAGRGPVLGPMVYGTAFCPVSQIPKLKQMGFADSKVLSEAQRDDLLEVIKSNNDVMAWNARVLSPQDICGSSLRIDKYNLNALSHDTAIDLIRCAIAKGINLTEIYVDTVGHAGKYQEKLEGLFPGKKIRVESKADSKYAIVSAASIVAKTMRDNEIRNFQFEEKDMDRIDRKFGSGYPGDPNTKAWLRNNIDPIFGFPGLVRFSWSTVTKLMDEYCAPVYMNDESDDEEPEKGQRTLFECAGVTKEIKKQKTRHNFFESRNFNMVKDF
eukprot:CFRG5209T1